MSKSKKTKNFILRNVTAFLSDKPIWVSWIFYVAVTGALFGIFYFAFYLLTIQWWVGVLILLAIGIIWGSVKNFRIKGKIKAESKETVQSV